MCCIDLQVISIECLCISIDWLCFV